MLLILGAPACGRLVAPITVAGSVLLYLSMCQLAAGDASSDGGDSMSMRRDRGNTPRRRSTAVSR